MCFKKPVKFILFFFYHHLLIYCRFFININYRAAFQFYLLLLIFQILAEIFLFSFFISLINLLIFFYSCYFYQSVCFYCKIKFFLFKLYVQNLLNFFLFIINLIFDKLDPDHFYLLDFCTFNKDDYLKLTLNKKNNIFFLVACNNTIIQFWTNWWIFDVYLQDYYFFNEQIWFFDFTILLTFICI